MIFFSWTEYFAYTLVGSIPGWLFALIALGIFNLMGLYVIWPFVFAAIVLVQGIVLGFRAKPKNEEQTAYLKTIEYKILAVFFIVVLTAFAFIIGWSVIRDASGTTKFAAQFDIMIATLPVMLLTTFNMLLCRGIYLVKKARQKKLSWYSTTRIISVIILVGALICCFIFRKELIPVLETILKRRFDI